MLESVCEQQAQMTNSEIKNAAIKLLARRDYSRTELWNKLSPKFGKADELNRVLDQLAADNYQSDERFAEAFIQFKKNQGKGLSFIRFELKNKGVSETLIEALLDGSSEEWQQIAKDVYERKFSGRPIDSPKEKAKRIRFMSSRGFSHDQIFKLL